MICNVITSPCGRSSFAIGAVSVAAVTALVIFELLSPASFLSSGGFVLYAIPGVTGFVAIGFFVASIVNARRSQEPLSSSVSVGQEEKPVLIPPTIRELIQCYTEDHSVRPVYVDSRISKHWNEYDGSIPEQGVTYEPARDLIGIQLRDRLIALAGKYSREQCEDLQSTARALEVEEEALQELFEFCGFPEVSWNDAECLEAFFKYCGCIFDEEGKISNTLLEYDLNLDAYFEGSHPFWPKILAPSQNKLTIKQFAQFLFMSVDALKEKWEDLKTKEEDDLLEIGEMKFFCTVKQRLSLDDRPRIWDAWCRKEKNLEIIFTQRELEAL